MVRFATVEYVDSLAKTIREEMKTEFGKVASWTKVVDTEINSREYIFDKFNSSSIYCFYVTLTKNNITYTGNVLWMPEIETLHNDINDYLSTSSNNLIFNPHNQKIRVTDWDKKEQVMSKIIVYELKGKE